MKNSSTLENGQIIKFDNLKKVFEYVKKLGAGGTGDTHLLKDNTTDMQFAFKKYLPKDEKRKNELYERFVEEIKILFKISHPNIVRIYNYYLYPELKLGYLQMEYIDGISIDNYSPFLDRQWNSIFLQVINAFRYLEERKILHRDIRPQNILIDKLNNVKIIDFGFGKIIDNDVNEENSIVLNWPVSRYPEEIILKREYTHCTEIYFVGKLFKYILTKKNVKAEDFNYFSIIDKMSEYQEKNRYSTFEDVYNDISEGLFSELNFSDDEKKIYREFSDSIYRKISEYSSEYLPINDVEKIIQNIANILRKNSLEVYIQNNSELISCFLKNKFSYYNIVDIEKEKVEKFYRWFVSLANNKQINVIENINTKLSNIRIKKDYDNLPF